MPRTVALGAVRFAVIDVETTGFSPWLHDRVVEIAVVRVEPERGIVDEYATLVNPRRDVGPTSVHGITASDVLDAPTFSEIAGDVAHRLHDAVLVAHNIRFDQGFITAEFRRTGIDMPQLPGICTLKLAGRLRPGLASRKLYHCCDEAGIRCDDAHSALGDARSTAHLLACYLTVARQLGWTSLQALGCEPLTLPDPWCSMPASGREVPRRIIRDRRAEGTYLARLVEKLPPTPFEDPDEAAYLDILDRCLADRRVTAAESDALLRTAEELGLTRGRVFEAHHEYLARLVETARADGTVTATERQDLEVVCAVLGLHVDALDAALNGSVGTHQDRTSLPSNLAGMTICFTGELQGNVDGEPLTRERAEALATAAGLLVRKSVTKTLQLLVAADSATQSSKAKRAREYGIQVISAENFWPRIGVRLDR